MAAACGRGWVWRPVGLQGTCSVVSEEKLLTDSMLVEAREALDEDLLVVHTRRYLNELKVQGLGAASPEKGLGEGQLSPAMHSLQGLHSCP